MADVLSEHDIELFRGKNFGHIATLMPDGSPHVSPVWIDVKDGLIWVNTLEGRIKPRNVRRDPRVAISVQALDDPEDDVVIVRGRVVEITTDGGADHIDELSRRYRGQDYDDRKPDLPRLILKIRPDHVAH